MQRFTQCAAFCALSVALFSGCGSSAGGYGGGFVTDVTNDQTTGDTTIVTDTKDTTTPGDSTTPQDTTPGGPTASLKCVQTACASQWDGCKSDASCTKGITCMDACPLSNQACVLACYDTSGKPQALTNLLMCAQNTDCIGQGPTCGDGKCETGETQANCAADCGAATP